MLCGYLILKVIILRVWKQKQKQKKLLPLGEQGGLRRRRETEEKLLSETARTHTTFID